MIAGAPLTYWIGFHAVVLLLLVVDLVVLGRKQSGPSFRAALAWTLIVIALALGFAGFLLHVQGQQRALEFISGYVIEASLSLPAGMRGYRGAWFTQHPLRTEQPDEPPPPGHL